nr:hypothetical protein [uncultured Carboxylicivirga sp.]
MKIIKRNILLSILLIAGVTVSVAQTYYKNGEQWVIKSEEIKPKLIEEVIQPQRMVAMVENKDAFQGWEASETITVDEFYHQSFREQKSVIIDFGDHYTGYFSMDLQTIFGTSDAPVRFKLTFGEVPAELATPFDPYKGDLSRAWLQDEVVTVMHIPSTVSLSRRISGRYMKIELLGASRYFDFRISEVRFRAYTSVANQPDELATTTPDKIKAIDNVSQKTLKECMQTVYEDGPKRDRRLWVGDMYLESLANTVTFKNHQLTQRCLYLLAGLSDEEGYVLGTVFETPEPHAQAHQRLMDYSLLYNCTLKEYLKATGDIETANELWPVAKRQLDIIQKYVSEKGMVDYKTANKEWWLFFDWKEGLNKEAAIQGLMMFALNETYTLAKQLNKQDEVSFIPALVKKMKKAAIGNLYNKSTGLFESGVDKQISYASQVWMILGGALTEKQGKRALKNVMSNKEALFPGGPYMYHYFIQSLINVGMTDEAKQQIMDFWGGMVEKGADTFWEVYSPTDDFLSPYHFYPVNSYCHAWSCTPTYFIRKYPEIFQK